MMFEINSFQTDCYINDSQIITIITARLIIADNKKTIAVWLEFQHLELVERTQDVLKVV